MQGNASTGLFDVNQFLETTHKGQLDTTFVLPPEGDYRAQTTDKITSRSGIIGPDKDRAGEAWANFELQWELLDENLRKTLNMPHVYVRQGVMVDLDQQTWLKSKQVVIDWGINKNMRLKRLLDATGLNKLKEFSINMLKHQQGYVTVVHRRVDGFDDVMAEVSRVASVSKAPA